MTLSGDRGMSLVELSVVVALMSVILAVLATVVSQTQNSLQTEISRSATNDQIRQASQSIDREARSGNVLYDPATESYAAGDVAAGMSMRILTQANAPTRGGSRCIQWRITGDRRLQRRTWATNWQSNPSTLVRPWETVAENVTNRADGLAAFSKPSPNIVDVVLRANSDPTGRRGRTVEVRQSISGRNTVFSSPDEPCGPPTPDPSLAGAGGSRVPPY